MAFKAQACQGLPRSFTRERSAGRRFCVTKATYIKCPQGGPCKFKLELQPASGVVIPQGFSYYAEWLGPDDEQSTSLQSIENAHHVPAGSDGVYIE